MAVNTQTFGRQRTVDTSRGFSGLWGDCPLSTIRDNPGEGYWFFDDFVDFGIAGTQTSEINLGRYKVYNTGSGTVASNKFPNSTGTQLGGVISMLCDTAGDQSVIGTHACPYSLASTAGKLWFEARIATTSVATAMTHIFIGLGNNADVTFGAAIPLADADATGTAVALVGFARLEDGQTALNTVLTDEGATYNYGGTPSTNIQTGAGTLAADTWIKVGMMYDPKNASRCLRFFVNGVEASTAVTSTILAATTHLDASGLGPVFAQFADTSGTSNYAYLDWWACYQQAV